MIYIKIENNILQLRTPYSEKDRCTMIPGGRWNPVKRVWEYLLTPATAQAVMAVFGIQSVPAELVPTLKTLASRLVVHQQILAGTCKLVEPVSKTKSWKHQITAYNLAINLMGLKDE